MNKLRRSGFTLVQLSVMLMVASLVMVTILPSSQVTLDNNRVTSERMNALYKYFRAYMAANGGKLPCPADATLAQGASNYGVAAANSGSATDCSGGTPAANYVDASHNVAIGMVPVKSLGLSNDYAYDAWGRTITYAVDTAVTGNCWTSPAAGAITVTDNGTANTTVMALISHGANGHGAFIPLAGASGTAVRLNNNSSDTNELLNAHVDSSFAPTSTLTNFVLTVPTSTFDDVIVYKSPYWTMGKMPASATASGATITSVLSPTFYYYYYYPKLPVLITDNKIDLYLNFDSAVTVTGNPRLAITPVSVGGGTVSVTGNGGSGAIGYANYTTSYNGGKELGFSYPVQATDMAPNGFTVTGTIDLNGGTISGACSLTFTPPSLSGVIIPKTKAILTSGTFVAPVDWNNSYNYIAGVGSGGNGARGSGTTGGGGGGGGAFGLSYNFSTTAGTNIPVTVGTAGGTSRTTFYNASTLDVDYGKNASGGTSGTYGAWNSSTVTGPGAIAYSGGGGGSGNGVTYGGGGGGGGSAGGDIGGSTGGSGGRTGGGGGGGGAANSTIGSGTSGAFSGGGGGAGGQGYDAVAPSGGSAGVAGTPGTTDRGSGGGGGGGTSTASTASGAGGNGSAAVQNGPTILSWTTNQAPTGTYAVGSGGGGSGGARGTTSNSAVAGSSISYGGGGGGSGGATGTAGNAGTGSPGLIIVVWR